MRAQQVVLTRSGALPVEPSAFALADVDLPAPGPGEALVQVLALSLDPYQRLRMRALDAGGVLPGGGVGRVLAGDLPTGTLVTGDFGWRSHAVLDVGALVVVEDHPGIETHHHVGLLGLSGLTAWFGVTRVLRPQPGEKIVVSGAYGGVGQVAVQLALAAGASVAGIAGGAQKCAAVAALGATPLDHRSPLWVSSLEAWAPDGVDGYFDNVWGDVASRVVEHLRPLGRIALCGQMAGLTAGGQVPPLDIDWYLILTRSLTLQGFRTVDYLADYAQARKEIAQLLLDGKLHQEVEVVDGLGAAGEAFTRLTSGQVLGKAVVRV
jgi:NADPH-dependent curcumin reductase CurA